MGNRKYLFLYPCSLIYGMITGFRNFLYDTGILPSHEFHIPVICVGNITVGGTGKTPHTEYLVELLRGKFRVAILSRGYKRISNGFQVATATSSVKDIGDEPLQIYRKFPDILVAVDRNRVNGVQTILKEYPETEVIILDDGFQHRSLTPGLSILLSDFNRPVDKDHLVPYGNLRENKKNIKRADVILITKSPGNISPINQRIILKNIEKAPYQDLFFTTISYKDPLPVFENNTSAKFHIEDSTPEKRGAVLITGIAVPEPFRKYLDKYFGEIIHLNFTDHHHFSENDLEKIVTAWNGLKSPYKVAITTEKDAVRLREFTNIAESVKMAFYYIPVGVSFLNEGKHDFDNLIFDYVRKNKRNNRVS
jgi:tetraacyldisaccharide 4'-kinase